MKKTNRFVLVMLTIQLCGCVSAVVEGAHMTKEEVVRSRYKAAAERGDKVAQFKIGESYCCSTSAKSGVAYDTETAVHWLCESAQQGYGPAMYKLGKIYSGDVIDGLRLARRIITAAVESVDGSTVNLPIAYAWLKMAQAQGIPEATDRLNKVKNEMRPLQLISAEKIAARGVHIPCEIDEVFRD